MNEFTKFIWLLFILVLWIGAYAFLVVAVYAVILGLIAWLKPEWLDKF